MFLQCLYLTLLVNTGKYTVFILNILLTLSLYLKKDKEAKLTGDKVRGVT